MYVWQSWNTLNCCSLNQCCAPRLALEGTSSICRPRLDSVVDPQWLFFWREELLLRMVRNHRVFSCWHENMHNLCVLRWCRLRCAYVAVGPPKTGPLSSCTPVGWNVAHLAVQGYCRHNSLQCVPAACRAPGHLWPHHIRWGGALDEIIGWSSNRRNQVVVIQCESTISACTPCCSTTEFAYRPQT